MKPNCKPHGSQKNCAQRKSEAAFLLPKLAAVFADELIESDASVELPASEYSQNSQSSRLSRFRPMATTAPRS
jgi:hypothetical protein